MYKYDQMATERRLSSEDVAFDLLQKIEISISSLLPAVVGLVKPDLSARAHLLGQACRPTPLLSDQYQQKIEGGERYV